VLATPQTITHADFPRPRKADWDHAFASAPRLYDPRCSMAEEARMTATARDVLDIRARHNRAAGAEKVNALTLRFPSK